MNIFKKNFIHWMVIFLVDVMAIILSCKMIANGNIRLLNLLYESIYSDILIIAVFVPNFIVLILDAIGENIKNNIILAYGSKMKWIGSILKKIIVSANIYSFILLLPIFAVFIIGSGFHIEIVSIIYFFILFMSYSVIFIFLSLVACALKIKWRSNILGVITAVLISFIPNILSFLFRGNGLPVFSQLINVTYAFRNGHFFIFQTIFVCVTEISLSFIIYLVICKIVMRKDF